VDASQSFLTGGGTGVVTVAMETSPIILKASLHAWYIRSISSRFNASSGLSSIIDDWKTIPDTKSKLVQRAILSLQLPKDESQFFLEKSIRGITPTSCASSLLRGFSYDLRNVNTAATKR